MSYVGLYTTLGVFIALNCGTINATLCGLAIWSSVYQIIALGWGLFTKNDDYLGLVVTREQFPEYTGPGTHAVLRDPGTSQSGGIRLVYKDQYTAGLASETRLHCSLSITVLMNRISIPSACLALLVLSSPGLAQVADGSVSPADVLRPVIAMSASVATRADAQRGGLSARDNQASTSGARQRIVTGAVTGLAIGVIGLTVGDLTRGDRRERNIGTDAAIVVSAAVIGALVNYGRMRATSSDAKRTR